MRKILGPLGGHLGRSLRRSVGLSVPCLSEVRSYLLEIRMNFVGRSVREVWTGLGSDFPTDHRKIYSRVCLYGKGGSVCQLMGVGG